MIDHITIHIPAGTFADPDLETFISSLGFESIRAAESVPDGWQVRWYMRRRVALLGIDVLKPDLHLVETPVEEGEARGWKQDHYGMGHICVNVGRANYNALRASKWCVRDSGSGRIWLEFANLRFEVRP